MQSLFIPQWDELIFSGALLPLVQPYPSSTLLPLSGACLRAESLQISCVQLCDSMGCSLPGSSAHGILQA